MNSPLAKIKRQEVKLVILELKGETVNSYICWIWDAYETLRYQIQWTVRNLRVVKLAWRFWIILTQILSSIFCLWVTWIAQVMKWQQTSGSLHGTFFFYLPQWLWYILVQHLPNLSQVADTMLGTAAAKMSNSKQCYISSSIQTWNYSYIKPTTMVIKCWPI